MQLTNSILVLGATASVAFAQSTTSTAMTPQQTCLSTCNLGDVNCQAACLGNPYPNDSDANATTECSKKCVQGNGTQAETEAYAMCLQRCRTSFFPVGTGVYNGPTAAPSTAVVTSVSMSVGATTPMETGSSSVSSGSGSGSGSSSSSGSGSGSSSNSNSSNNMGSESASASMSMAPSASMSGSGAQQTGAAGVNGVAVSSFSLAALVAAIFAL